MTVISTVHKNLREAYIYNLLQKLFEAHKDFGVLNVALAQEVLNILEPTGSASKSTSYGDAALNTAVTALSTSAFHEIAVVSSGSTLFMNPGTFVESAKTAFTKMVTDWMKSSDATKGATSMKALAAILTYLATDITADYTAYTANPSVSQGWLLFSDREYAFIESVLIKINSQITSMLAVWTRLDDDIAGQLTTSFSMRATMATLLTDLAAIAATINAITQAIQSIRDTLIIQGAPSATDINALAALCTASATAITLIDTDIKKLWYSDTVAGNGMFYSGS